MDVPGERKVNLAMRLNLCTPCYVHLHVKPMFPKLFLDRLLVSELEPVVMTESVIEEHTPLGVHHSCCMSGSIMCMGCAVPGSSGPRKKFRKSIWQTRKKEGKKDTQIPVSELNRSFFFRLG